MIALRLRDTAFKRVLKTMREGTDVEISGPYGSFALPEEASNPIVFLAGGIGITPFRSMSIFAGRKKLPHRIFLFYSNRRPKDAPFLEELEALQKENHNFTLIATMTEGEKSQEIWSGETGYIQRAMFEKYIKTDLQHPLYYIAGPPAMVFAMRGILAEIGVSESRVLTEQFSGY